MAQIKVVERRDHHLCPLFLKEGDTAWPEWAKRKLCNVTLPKYSQGWKNYLYQHRPGEFNPPALHGGMFVQVDCFLLEDGREIVICEIENSIAGYDLLRILHPNLGDAWREALNKWAPAGVWVVFSHPEKKQSTLYFEWGGKPTRKQLEMSGFVGIVGPGDPLPHEGSFQPRTSRPLSWLRRPGPYSDVLQDLYLRRAISERSMVPNVDDPRWSLWDSRVVNDSKAPYLSLIDAQVLESVEGFEGKFEYTCRAKPLRDHYGGYGHITITQDGKRKKKIAELRHELKCRGPYAIQKEYTPPSCDIPGIGRCVYIDRVFCALDTDLRWKYAGGLRCYMPASCREAQRNRIHGNPETIWACIW
ncbi:MAG: hypothetical protein KatS3mg100_275 [Candidatus Parcubacteria bacterium]|nr:MAG: hypothetical protein KatS3mg100_275 [Candidatus Parcubacteria bacterium]